MPRTPSRRVATSAGCAPLCEVFEECRSAGWSSWLEAENAFLEAMWRFDQNFIAGIADQGDNQNGKGDFFTDLLSVLLENCSGKELDYRPAVAGRMFRGHALDAAYPAEGAVEVFIETKACGAPKTSRNPRQRNPLGRRGSADLDKRVKEAGLKTIDLKAEWARREGKGGGPTGDFITWLRRSKPSCYLLLAVRTVDESDLKHAIHIADTANQVMDATAIFAFRPDGMRYVTCAVPTNLEIDRVLSRICDQLRDLP